MTHLNTATLVTLEELNAAETAVQRATSACWLIELRFPNGTVSHWLHASRVHGTRWYRASPRDFRVIDGNAWDVDGFARRVIEAAPQGAAA